MNLTPYQGSSSGYEHLSLKDLLEARDQYHVHLMQHPNVIATAIGRYRIRVEDDWPDERSSGVTHHDTARTLANSEIRPYSWPAVLVFVDKWEPPASFHAGGKFSPDAMVPKTLYLPDGRRAPVCVIEAPRESVSSASPLNIQYPLNNIGGGWPVLTSVQGREHFATIACLVTDGHRIYGLTNRHVTGEPGEILYSELGGKRERIGVSAAPRLTRMPFSDVYSGWAGRGVYVNLDAGLIDIDDLEQWTAEVRDVGVIGPLADLSVYNLTLSMVGCHVRGYGSATGMAFGEIQALFYRYKAVGGFEYVADFFIGPRVTGMRRKRARSKRSDTQAPNFATLHGDSGRLFLLEPRDDAQEEAEPSQKSPLLPLAIQWGEQRLESAATPQPQSYALATSLSTICSLLGVDPVRDWNLDQPDTWGAVGHFSIASRVAGALSDQNGKLARLMKKNLEVITHDDDTILNDDFKGMGEADFVPLADVPDFFWKHGKQGASRPFEGPNHFADMDQPGDDGKTLLTLCEDPQKISPEVWNAYYDSVSDILTGDPIEQKHRGLLPFRVWQIFDKMRDFASEGKAPEFVCAAGVLTHYIGDACQPLHISYLHDGDPEQPVTRTVHHRDETVEKVKDPLGKGLHAAYEDDMVNANRQRILSGLDKTKTVNLSKELISNGFEAAVATVALMRETFQALPPGDILQAFLELKDEHSKKTKSEEMWKKFGRDTIKAMSAGVHLLAVLWESAWSEGHGDDNVKDKDIAALDPGRAMDICRPRTFLESLSIERIGAALKQPSAI